MGHVQDSLPTARPWALAVSPVHPGLPCQVRPRTFGCLTFSVSMHFPVLQSQTLTWKSKQAEREGGLTKQVWPLQSPWGQS